MVYLTQLWLPIVLSAVIVFVVSSILHMVLPFHKNDYRKLPDEEKLMEALRAAGVTSGPAYHFPHCSHKEMNSPEMKEKFKKGPLGFITVFPSGPPNMGKFLGTWFLYCLIVGVFTAYLTGRTVAPHTDYLHVFRVAGTIAFMGYGLGHFVDSVWKGQTWGVTFKHMFDGLVYALLTAGTFGWLWPR
jgi:hypothetical protein